MIARYSRPHMANIWLDENKFSTMLKVEIVACEAMAELGFVPRKALGVIKKKAGFDVSRIEEIEKKTNHDLIAFLWNVAEHVGGEAKYIHAGLTSSDVIDTSYALMMAEAVEILIGDTEELLKEIRRQALRHRETVMMGRSHGMHAEPTTFGLKMALFYDEMGRNLDRLKRAKRIIAVGKISGAVGTYANIDPFVEKYVCRKLGLEPAKISSQILQRDRHAEYMTALALTASTLEKYAVEFRHLQRTEVGEVQEFFAKNQKGSSAMPHKRNPIICERISGLARVIRGNAFAAMENIALWHERDISHSSAERVIVPDSTILLDYILAKMTDVVKNLIVNKERMIRNMNQTKGVFNSQRILLELLEKGLGREEAYNIVQPLAMKALSDNVPFIGLLKENQQIRKYLSEREIDKCFNVDYHLKHTKKIFKKVGIT